MTQAGSGYLTRAMVCRRLAIETGRPVPRLQPEIKTGAIVQAYEIAEMQRQNNAAARTDAE